MKTKAKFSGLISMLFFLLGSVNVWAIPVVLEGHDLFTTEQPTNFLGIPFEGDPLGTFDFGDGNGLVDVGLTDTIIHRISNAECVPDAPPFPCSNTINIEMVALSLKSVVPVDLGAGLDIYHVVLDGGSTSLGQMTITFDDVFGGTFTSFWDNIDIEIRKGASDGLLVQSLSLTGLTNSGSPWGRDHSPSSWLIDAINHTLNGIDHAGDFWPGMLPGGLQDPGGCIVHGNESVPASHCIRTSTVPIAPAIWLFCSALGMLGWRMRRIAV